ncbi:calpain family cysteine protease domain-containing protein [Ditylenchus destructor]|uniref:Calpain family cysteine protease domain-containing protein n=1 Tax=Ditylenchus destructor TaxID=166010 RepID=A0AAD4NHA3_9BILA|nr:calpain family cysteine protease domain-containing protein [Ditylenchus destructor]
MNLDVANYYAEQAVGYDKSGRYDAAIYSYLEAARVIFHLIDGLEVDASYKDVAQKYLDRAGLLRDQSANAVSSHVKSEHQLNVEKAEFLLNEALNSDESEKIQEAQDLYAQAVDFCLKCSKSSADEQKSTKFRQLALRALERAEALKQVQTRKTNPMEMSTINFPSVPVDEISQLSLSHEAPTESGSNWPVNVRPTNSMTAPRRKPADDVLTESELKVLATTSKINKRTYVPFLSVDAKERFAFTIPFSDKDGLLALSEKQKKRLKCWMRPDEFMEEPTVIDRIDSGTIKQTIVSDCSFVASLAIAARYERRFGTQLITNIIFPQNRNSVPIHNPCGKYMVKLNLNGIWRKVIIDDRLPVGHNGELLCSYSQNKNELWVSLLEKAYMKVMGGYDFPGSNSNIDLNALTGWIPERIAIRKDSPEFNKDKVFERLFSRFHQGHCLITLATGKMEESEQERTGLVDAHAYAVLDLRKFESKRLLLVKNPWTHLRWKGRFSEKDTTSWTPEMCKALDYNPQDAQQFDDGVFWIDYESVCAFFDVFYVNWSPQLFPFTYALHSTWNAGIGPVKDLYTVGDNPQYYLEVNNKQKVASVWILLTRHITEKDDFADNKEYITVIIYKSEGKRIYLPYDPKPIVEGARINSPHYLCQMLVKEPGIQRFTLVVAQYEKSNTIHYTLRIYSSAAIKCGSIKVPYKKTKKEAGEWRGQTAAGCGSDGTGSYLNNPLYHIMLEDGSDDNSILIDLRGPKEYSVGFELVQVSSYRNRPFERRDSGAFRPGFTILQLEHVPGGTYALRPMTFLAGQQGPFLIRVDSSCDFTVKKVQ